MPKEAEAFCNSVEARHIQPGFLLSSYTDLMKSDWYVESVATLVKGRRMQVTMTCSGRRITSTIDPEDTVLRKIYKSQF